MQPLRGGEKKKKKEGYGKIIQYNQINTLWRGYKNPLSSSFQWQVKQIFVKQDT